MNLKSITTVCAFAFGGIVLGGVTFAETTVEPKNADATANEANSPPDGIQALREQVGAIMSRANSPDMAQGEITLKEQLSVIIKQLDELVRREDERLKAAQAAKPKPEEGPKPTAEQASKPKADEAAKPKGDEPVKKGGLKTSFYGVMDVSFDDTTKGIAGKVATQYTLANPPDVTTLTSSIHAPPVGRNGYLPALSTNKSSVGGRGNYPINGGNTNFIFQLELSLAITASPGLATSYTQQSDAVKGAVSGYVGLSDKAWGSLKFGTTYAPYKSATDRMNPFSGMLGDYAAVMGNSGGDNRVEFGTRLDHSIWYQSPQFGGGFSIDALFSPGQNRTFDNVVQSAGSPDCNGGNMPGSGNLPLNCDDGGFSDALSGALKFASHGFYAVVAYEYHKDVNRNSDGIGSNNYLYQVFAFNNPTLTINANNNPQGLPASALGAYTTSIGNETAFKAGASYDFPFKLSLGGIWERLRRDIPAYLAFQNERSRDGFWLYATQGLGSKASLSVGWAHAGKTPGDPGGQHNYNPFAKADTANMYTVAIRHKIDKQFSVYANYADTVNHGNVHYDLGAGGRGLTTDCHDGTNTVFTDYSGTGPTTWGGCHIQGFTVGMHYTY
jgi:predicted porin